MFYKVNKAAVYATLGISLAAMSGTAFADALVNNSAGAAAREYPRGTRLADNAVITLGRGDTVTVLTSSGTRRFDRPGRHSLSGSRQLASNTAGTVSGSRGRARTGAVRSGEGAAAATYPDRGVWQVNVEHSGTFCYLPSQPIALWRESADSARDITITRVSDQQSATVRFDAQQAAKDWPASLPAQSGAEYEISEPNDIVSRRVTFNSLAADPQDVIAVGAALMDRDCAEQLDALVSGEATESSAEDVES